MYVSLKVFYLKYSLKTTCKVKHLKYGSYEALELNNVNLSYIFCLVNYTKIVILFNRCHFSVIVCTKRVSNLLHRWGWDFKRRALGAKVSKSSSEVDQFSMTKATRLEVSKDIRQLLVVQREETDTH